MDIIEEQADGITTMTLRGRLDTATAPILQLRVSELIEAGVDRFVMNLSELEYINSTGLRALQLAAKRESALGGRIVMWGVQPLVRRSFEVAGFDRMFVLCDTREEALLAAAGRSG